MSPRTFTLNFMGDTMLGRLIDQMFPTHIHEPEEARIAESLGSRVGLHQFAPATPWGDTLPLLRAAGLNLLNLETSVTTHPTKWPNKVFNYRMRPANVKALRAGYIDYIGLANNHTLDFSERGLLETVQIVREAELAFAGAGETQHEAQRPAVLQLMGLDGMHDHEVHVWAASDHPQEWASVPNFHFIDYTQETRRRLKALLTASTSAPAALRIFSVHWGPNYLWQPAQEIQDLAHFLIDQCGMDIIHGHSSHHVQGVEKYKGKLIIYGCGDFVDDYALVREFRNDLSGIWRVTVEEKNETSGLALQKLEVFPTKFGDFRANLSKADEFDARWVQSKIKQLSSGLGTHFEIRNKGSASVELDLR